jgi:PDZ domain-containing protein
MTWRRRKARRRFPGSVAGSALTNPSMSDFDATADGEAAAIPTSDGFSAPVSTGRTWPLWPVILAVVGLTLVIIVWVLASVNVNYYAITPGDATPVAPFIEVPASFNHPSMGKILLTDVYVSQLTAFSYLQYRYFTSDSEVISASELLGPSTPQDQFIAQGYLEMAQAQTYATAAALSHLGYAVHPENAGTLIFGITPGSPAQRALKVAQVITGVDGVATPTDCDLINALHGKVPGTPASLTVEESSLNGVGTFVPGPTVVKTVTLGTPPKGLSDSGCGQAPSTPTAYLGIQPQTQLNWNFPVKVTVHTKNIGGPSAGLSMTLGIIDKLTGGRLIGNRVVAATGTIDPQGAVGDVGGVPEKTVAVERAGASVFFVPTEEFGKAESKAIPSLHVYAVSTLDQALKILKGLGGNVPASHPSTQAAP